MPILSSLKELVNSPVYYRELQICALLSVFIFIASCHADNQTKERVNEAKPSAAVLPKTSSVAPQASSLPPEDPTFIMSKDTVSTHGPSSITRNAWQDKNGTYWFATWEGIIKYDGKYFTNVTLKEGLRHFRVFSILEDNLAQLWFGTVGGGVYRYNGYEFTYFTTKDGLISNTVLCTLADDSGNVWLGTQDGLSRYDGNTFTNFTTQDGLNSNFISSVIQDKAGKIWIGTNDGVCYYNPSISLRTGGKSFTNFANEKGLNFYRVRSMLAAKTGNMWIGSADGLCRYDGKSFANFATHATYCIFEDRAGNFWLSDGKPDSPNMTLTKYDGKSFTTIKSDKQVFGITEDRTGNIWFGTVHGVCRYDGKTFTNFLD